jgi:hypothetical protein
MTFLVYLLGIVSGLELALLGAIVWDFIEDRRDTDPQENGLGQ